MPKWSPKFLYKNLLTIPAIGFNIANIIDDKIMNILLLGHINKMRCFSAPPEAFPERSSALNVLAIRWHRKLTKIKFFV